VHIFYSTIDSNIIFNAFCRLEGDFVLQKK